MFSYVIRESLPHSTTKSNLFARIHLSIYIFDAIHTARALVLRDH